MRAENHTLGVVDRGYAFDHASIRISDDTRVEQDVNSWRDAKQACVFRRYGPHADFAVAIRRDNSITIPKELIERHAVCKVLRHKAGHETARQAAQLNAERHVISSAQPPHAQYRQADLDVQPGGEIAIRPGQREHQQLASGPRPGESAPSATC